MRHIAALTPEKVPRDDEFHFRTRAKSLVDKWHTILGSSKTGEAGGEAAPNGASAEGAPVSPTHNSTSAAAVPEVENVGDVSMLSAA